MSKRGWFVVALVGVAAAAVFFAIPHLEGTPPVIGEIDSRPIGREGRTFTLELTDPDSGLRQIELRLLHGGGAKTLLSLDFPGGLLGGGPGTDSERIEFRIVPSELGLPDGALSLVLTARDWSWRDGFSGNRSERGVQLSIDTRAPDIRVLSGLTYVRRGGAGLAVYRVSETETRDGVRVGESFFPGYPLEDGGTRRVALFAVPVDSEIDPAARVVAVDPAGNESRAAFPLRVQERRFPVTPVSISQDFIEGRVAALARELDIDAPDSLAAFQYINTRTREQNERRIRELLQVSARRPLWNGAFQQLRASKVMSRFAEKRQYLYEDRLVSRARHLGFDLASTAAAEIAASNTGVVSFAGSLGIYGNIVLVDHGLGLASLYAHLSRLDVKAGEPVEQGQTLGLSGATGLAGGDHLHFAMLVSGTYVDPIAWWDPRWVRSHIEVRLERKVQ